MSDSYGGYVGVDQHGLRQQELTAAKYAGHSQFDTNNASIAPAPPPPLTERIEKLLSVIYEQASCAVDVQRVLLNRLFGPTPESGAAGPGQAEAQTFDDRVFAKLQLLAAMASTARDQAERLNTRI